jgi:hypothetical protein
VDASEYGPVLSLSFGSLTHYEINSSGCVEIAGQPDCAVAVQARDACVREACLAGCRPTSAAQYGAFTTCTTQARTTVCASYNTAAACLTSATAATCYAADAWVAIGTAYCAQP